jgi:ubiquinone/menaquinone biosynthesis C-methylase UbiE
MLTIQRASPVGIYEIFRCDPSARGIGFSAAFDFSPDGPFPKIETIRTIRRPERPGDGMSADALDVKSRAKVAYELMEHPWPPGDPWSTHTRESIGAFVRSVVPDARGLKILNAGCGNNDYGLRGSAACVNLDISVRQCRGLSCATVGDIESLPFADAFFDVTVCVGAVINYVEVDKAIPELVRVTKPRGLILIDFESSYSAEIMFSPQWRKPLSVIERMYIDHMDKTYLFSPAQIRAVFERNGSTIVKTGGYHIATAMWERVFTKALIPKAAFAIDSFAARVPGLRSLASSVLFACRKLDAPA